MFPFYVGTARSVFVTVDVSHGVDATVRSDEFGHFGVVGRVSVRRVGSIANRGSRRGQRDDVSAGQHRLEVVQALFGLGVAKTRAFNSKSIDTMIPHTKVKRSALVARLTHTG